MRKLISELNDRILPHLSNENVSAAEKVQAVCDHLHSDSAALFRLLPKDIQQQLLMDRDPHGNVQVSHIQTEKLLSTLVQERVHSHPFSSVHHFFGYEGRSAFPSNFDATYCYALGRLSAALICNGHTGYMSCIQGLTASPCDWEVCALPITSLMNMEMRSGKHKPVIQKALVDLEGNAFTTFAKKRAKWRVSDCYRYPGPIQFSGDSELVDQPPLSLQLRT